MVVRPLLRCRSFSESPTSLGMGEEEGKLWTKGPFLFSRQAKPYRAFASNAKFVPTQPNLPPKFVVWKNVAGST